MLSEKPWKLDAVLRLTLSVCVCVLAGSLVASVVRYAGAGGKGGWKVAWAAASALGFLGATLYMVRKPWALEKLPRRLLALMVCLYAGFFLGAWAQSLMGPMPVRVSAGQILIGVLSFQGATLYLVHRFLREYQISWGEAFGFGNDWRHAVFLGLMIACIFLPVALGLQRGVAELMEWLTQHLTHFPIKPEQQQAVQALRIAKSWGDRLVLGLATIVLAPIAEEVLFRGILYTWVKQLGYPRLALWGSALVFASMHGNFLIFVPLLVLALVLALLYERTNNLLASIAAHSLFNGLNFAMLYLLEKQIG